MPESRLERAWRERSSSARLKCHREDSFDLTSGLFYAPLKFRAEAVESDSSPSGLSLGRVTDHFVGFVRSEFGRWSGEGSEGPPSLDFGEPAEIDLRAYADQLLNAAERTVYGDDFQQFVDSVAQNTLPARLHGLFGLSAFGRKENEMNVPVSWFADFLTARIAERTGTWLLAVPSLPFRDQNPFRSPNEAADATLAEVLFLARLHAISLGVYQLVPGGMHVVVLSDGSLYADCLGVERSEADAYLESIRQLRDSLNLWGTVSILELRELAEDAAVALGTDFWSVVDEIDGILQQGLADDEWAGQSAFRNLLAGVRWNLNLRDSGLSLDDLWRTLVCSPDEFLGPDRRRGLGEQIVVGSRRYAAINVAIKLLEPVELLLPDALRATIHPKEDQIGLPRFGSVAPWNGVACVQADSNTATIEAADVHPLYRLARSRKRCVPLTDNKYASGPIGFKTLP